MRGGEDRERERERERERVLVQATTGRRIMSPSQNRNLGGSIQGTFGVFLLSVVSVCWSVPGYRLLHTVQDTGRGWTQNLLPQTPHTHVLTSHMVVIVYRLDARVAENIPVYPIWTADV